MVTKKTRSEADNVKRHATNDAMVVDNTRVSRKRQGMCRNVTHSQLTTIDAANNGTNGQMV